MGESGVEASGDWVRSAVGRFEGPLTRYAHRLLGDAERARDVVQDAFVKLCGQNRGEVEPRLAEWLFTVVRNRSTDVLRKEGRMSGLSVEQQRLRVSPEPGPAAAVEQSEESARVLAMLESLPPTQREVIRLKFQEGFSYREISRISGQSVTNVGYLIHVGLKTLRAKLGVEQPNTAVS